MTLVKRSVLLLKNGKIVYSTCSREKVAETLSKQGYLKTCDFKDIGIWELMPLKINDIQLIAAPKEIDKLKLQIEKKKRIADSLEYKKQFNEGHQQWLKRLGKILHQLRCSRNWTVTHMAKEVGVNTVSIKGYEAGNQEIKYHKLKRYASVFDVQLSEIYRAAKMKVR